MLNIIHTSLARANRAFSITALMGALLLGFAYGSQYFGFSPCRLCIEIRFWISCAVILSVIGMLASNLLSPAIKAIGTGVMVLNGVAAIYAIRLVLIEHGVIMDSGCTPFTFYSAWLPLDAWWPGMYTVEGLCGIPSMVTSWLSYSQLSALGLVTVSIACFFVLKKHSYLWK